MPRPRSTQELIHWLEMGRGAGAIRLAATVLAIAVLSVVVAWKQFHGVTSEAALVQADVGRQIAGGEGFTTLVNYPQAAAFLQSRGHAFDAQHPYPELYQAPLYSVVIAAALRLLPGDFRASLFAEAPVPPDGFRGDYFLLGLNLILLWLAAGVTFALARRLFDPRVAWASVLALLLSVGIWQQTVVAGGAPLLMLLAVVTFWIWTRVEETVDQVPRRALTGMAALGGGCGLLFLTEYAAGSLILVALVYAAVRFPRFRRLHALVMVTVGFLFVSGPWLGRNIALTGHPVALAAQNGALKAGDPTAEPSDVRRTFAADQAEVDLNKLANKTLTGLQESLKERIWSGGALWLAGFFVAGWLYAFRSPVANRMRWVVTAALGVMILAQAGFNSGESERLVTGWLAPLIIVFGTGFFSVLLTSNAALSQWPRLSVAGLLVVQALPLVHDALEPRRLHFQYPPYFPSLFMGMRADLEHRDTVGRFGVMADVPAGVAWYSGQRVWAQPVRLRDFYAITLEQPMGELLLTPRTLDRPFFSELAARPVEPGALKPVTELFGDWGQIYAGLFTGRLPADFPLSAPQKLAENLYVLLNPALPPAPGK